MKVFLAGIIQGSRADRAIHDQQWRRVLIAQLRRHLPKARVYCHYTRHPHSITYDLPHLRRTLEQGLRRAAQCDLLVAYVPGASMGTAIEMYQAARHGAVVIAISPMAANWVLRAYSQRVLPDLKAFEEFLASGKLAAMLARRRPAAPGRRAASGGRTRRQGNARPPAGRLAGVRPRRRTRP